MLVSPISKAPLQLIVLEATRDEIEPEYLELAECSGINVHDCDLYVDRGVLICQQDKLWFPIIDGLPILLPYHTDLHKRFAENNGAFLESLGAEYRPPNETPVEGEEFVMRSFSEEWKDYKYDGVIWELDYDDHERRFVVEVGLDAGDVPEGKFLEVGCGVGITTYHAFKNTKRDCVGVDHSLASMNAVRKFRNNPFLHFAQASAFYLPFKHDYFSRIYSRGALHHTYSTKQAFDKVARHCASGGSFYL